MIQDKPIMKNLVRIEHALPADSQPLLEACAFILIEIE